MAAAAAVAHATHHEFVPHPRDDFSDEPDLVFHAGDKVVFRAPGTGQMLGGKIVRVAHHCVPQNSKVCLEKHVDDGSAGVPYYIVESESLNKCCGCYAADLKKFSGPSFAVPSGSFLKKLAAEEAAEAAAAHHTTSKAA
eukprot:tig00020629_g12415.t1